MGFIGNCTKPKEKSSLKRLFLTLFSSENLIIINQYKIDRHWPIRYKIKRPNYFYFDTASSGGLKSLLGPDSYREGRGGHGM